MIDTVLEVPEKRRLAGASPGFLVAIGPEETQSSAVVEIFNEELLEPRDYFAPTTVSKDCPIGTWVLRAGPDDGIL